MINVLPTNPLTYRWIILAVSFLLITVTNGLTLGGLYVFEEEIMKSLSQITGEDVLRADLKLRDAMTLWSTAVFGFFAGAVADKIGVKKLMVTGLSDSFSLFLAIQPSRILKSNVHHSHFHGLCFVYFRDARKCHSNFEMV